MKKLILILLLLWSRGALAACTGSSPTWTCATWADLKTLVDGGSSVNGDTINLASGTYNATSQIATGKYLKIIGAGGGTVQGSSQTTFTSSGSSNFTTGNKTFTLQTGTTIDTAGWTNGAAIAALYKPLATTYMVGTVVSWTPGTNSLIINVTASAAGAASTDYNEWTFSQEGATKINYNNTSASNDNERPLFVFTESSAGHIELSQIHFTKDAAIGMISGDPCANNQACSFFEAVNGSGQGVIVHDVRVSHGGGPRGNTTQWRVNRGLIYHLYMDCAFNWVSGCGNGAIKTGFGATMETSWSSVSEWGDDDVGGDGHLYVEDSYIVGFTQDSFDLDGSSRVVIRNSIFDHSVIASHGQVTSAGGMRYVDIYNNKLIAHNLTNPNHHTTGMDALVVIRGGTMYFHDNLVDDLNEQSDYPDRSEIKFQEWGLGYGSSAADADYVCWGADVPPAASAHVYPHPRQVGFGYVTGLGGSGSTGGYKGDSEPVRIWSNTGTTAVGMNDIHFNCSPGQDAIADYIQQNRDYFLTAASGYSAYQYPHEWRGAAAPGEGKGKGRNVGKGRLR